MHMMPRGSVHRWLAVCTGHGAPAAGVGDAAGLAFAIADEDGEETGAFGAGAAGSFGAGELGDAAGDPPGAAGEARGAGEPG
jgi:hypothetical protein